MAESLSPAMELARSRIETIRNAAKQLSMVTGGDKAECAFELICAAVLIIHESRPMAPIDVILEDGIKGAIGVVAAWFPDEVAKTGVTHG